MSFRAAVLAAFTALLLVPAAAPAARTVAPQPALDISKLPWEPVGFFKPGQPLPPTTDPPKFTAGDIFNPSGHWSAYDSSVFESLNFPTRQADDQSAGDAPGNGGMPYGFCPQGTDPQFFGAGRCANHQLEYLDYFERTMKAILGDFGVVVHRYQFDSPGSTNSAGVRSAAGNNAAGTSTAPGRSFNIGAEVPGADNPEETVIVSGHYDFTDSGPAAAWDSSEGHAEVIRMAKMMADYWRATGTRPSATIKFMPWDQEETGTVGSLDYVTNNVPPGEEDELRGYFHVDPCAGAYPAYYHGDGNDSNRVSLTLQLADPAGQAKPGDQGEFTDFNKQAERIVNDVFERVDGETVDTAQGKKPILVTEAESKRQGDPDFGKTPDRNMVVTGLGGLLLFSSDYRNFEGIGVPFFNFAPDMFGPHADPATDSPTTSSEGVAILHTPNDNLLTLNRLTGPDQTGQTASDGWMKGMELCSMTESWGMLQPNMAGAQRATSDPVAYYTALPNEAVADQQVTFDGTGSYQYVATGSRAQVPEDQLEWSWDFGDGTSGTGRVVKHVYAEVGRYPTTLTLRNRRTGQTDTMQVPITVVSSNFVAPVLEKPADKNDGGTFPLKWAYTGTRAGLQGFAVEESEDYRTTFTDDAEKQIDVNWTANKPTNPKIQPWQRSDSDTSKFRGNQKHSGSTSFWTGTSPADFPPPEAGDIVQGDSILTTKSPIDVPLKGSTSLQYFSLFQNEGDDTGRLEVAIDDGNPATPLDWSPVNVEQAVNTSAGSQDDLVCDPSQPATQSTGFHPVSVSLDQFHGRKLLVRFVMHYGAENRALSQPCGWYVDDIRVSNGEFTELGQTKAKDFTVTQAPTGADAYRIRGVFSDGVRTASSNIESVTVTNGGPSRKRKPIAGAGNQATSIACASTAGFELASVKTQKHGVRFGFSRRAGASAATVDILRVARGCSIAEKPKRVARFANREIAFTWNGRDARGRRLASGWYAAKLSARAAGRTDVRKVALRVSKGRVKVARGFANTPTCGLVRSFAASWPVFGGSRRVPLRASYRLGAATRVSVTLLRGKHAVRRMKTRSRKAGHAYALRFSTRGLRRGTYRLRLVAGKGRGRVARTITVRRL